MRVTWEAIARPTVIRQLRFLLATGMCASLCSGCSLSPPASASQTIGDACLVGSWSLDNEVNRSGWSYANTPLSVSGLHGARLTLGADGTEKELFAESNPLVGTLADGRVLSITIRGSFAFRLHADGHRYVETGKVTVVPVTANLDGVPVSDYHGSYSPGTGTYACSQRTLTTTTGSGVQTDTWSRN
jgi:hypothetical protein